MVTKRKVISKRYSSNKTMIIIDCFIEIDENRYLNDIVFFEIVQLDTKSRVKMLLDSHSLRAIAIAIESLANNKDISFKKFTKSNGIMKILYINIGTIKGSPTLYINLEEKGIKKIAHPFGIIGALAFSKELESIANILHKSLQYEYRNTNG